MTRESCIPHRAKQVLAIVRQDYYDLLDRDACGAALLNIFEYWANAAMVHDPDIERPWVGARPIREFEQLLLGIATDKQIRKRLALLEQRGFIQTKAPAKRGAAKEYQVRVPEIQAALVGYLTDDAVLRRSNDQRSIGQITDDMTPHWSNDSCLVGQTTRGASVKQPMPCRSNDRALKKKLQELEKEVLREGNFVLTGSALGAEANARPKTIQIGVVKYSQPPETIDLSDLWASNPGMAKSKLRFMAPRHKRLEMVAHGVGEWWIGPGRNDFDPWLIKACQARKRKLEQPAESGDAKTYLNNLLKQEDWANLELRCEEARNLRERATVRPPDVQTVEAQPACQNPSGWSAEAQRDSVLGLARFKVSQGQIEQATKVAERYGISQAEIGLAVDNQGLVAQSIP
ncbi:MAG: hypothetical protein AAFV72_11755 [Cyanobacteria bacterium J06635_1]